MPFLPLQDCDLYYEVHGSGPPLIFLHGGSGNQLSWWQQVPHFMDRYTCVTYAQRGCGLSVEAPGGPGPAGLAADLGALIEHLGFEDVTLVGHSMGGRAAVQYAVLDSSRIRAMVLNGSTGGIDDPAIVEAVESNRAEQDRDKLLARTDLGITDDYRQAQPALAYLNRAISRLSSFANDVEQRNRFYNRVIDMSAPADLVAKLEMPVLCIVGEGDRLAPPPAVKLFAQFLQHAEAVVVPNVRHSVYWERPDEFNRLVDGFLERIG